VKKLADRLRKDVARYAWRYADGDPEFARAIARDVVALSAVADLIDAGDLRAAYKRAERLDTIVRDAISKSVWNALSGGAAFGHTEHDA